MRNYFIYLYRLLPIFHIIMFYVGNKSCSKKNKQNWKPQCKWKVKFFFFALSGCTRPTVISVHDRRLQVIYFCCWTAKYVSLWFVSLLEYCIKVQMKLFQKTVWTNFKDVYKTTCLTLWCIEKCSQYAIFSLCEAKLFE